MVYLKIFFSSQWSEKVKFKMIACLTWWIGAAYLGEYILLRLEIQLNHD